jgi:hypothetical protein
VVDTTDTIVSSLYVMLDRYQTMEAGVHVLEQIMEYLEMIKSALKLLANSVLRVLCLLLLILIPYLAWISNEGLLFIAYPLIINLWLSLDEWNYIWGGAAIDTITS